MWLRVLLIIIAIVLLLLILMMVFMMPMMGMVGWWGGGSPGPSVAISPLWGIGMILVFLLVLLGIGYALYRAVTRSSLGGSDSAIEELRLTYARVRSPKKNSNSDGMISNRRSDRATLVEGTGCPNRLRLLSFFQ